MHIKFSLYSVALRDMAVRGRGTPLMCYFFLSRAFTGADEKSTERGIVFLEDGFPNLKLPESSMELILNLTRPSKRGTVKVLSWNFPLGRTKHPASPLEFIASLLGEV